MVGINGSGYLVWVFDGGYLWWWCLIVVGILCGCLMVGIYWWCVFDDGYW